METIANASSLDMAAQRTNLAVLGAMHAQQDCISQACLLNCAGQNACL